MFGRKKRNCSSVITINSYTDVLDCWT